MLGSQIRDFIAEAIQHMLKSKAQVDHALVQKTIEHIIDQVKALENKDLLPDKREVTIEYRSQKLPIKIRSPQDEATQKIYAKLKWIAVEQGELPPLLVERDLLGSVEVDPKKENTISSDNILSGIREARRQANQMAVDVGEQGSMQEFIKAGGE